MVIQLNLRKTYFASNTNLTSILASKAAATFCKKEILGTLDPFSKRAIEGWHPAETVRRT